MTKRKKPTGVEWNRLVEQWKMSNHREKLELALTFGVEYDTMKHWISDSGNACKKEDTRPEFVQVRDEILAIPTKVNLDFVSFDLETSELKADFSALLSAVIKPFGRDPIVFRCDNYPNWKEGRRAEDLDICTDIVRELSTHAVVVTHYGTGFDLRYIRAKMMKHGLPALPPMFAVDTYAISKQNMMVSRRRLDALCKYLSLGLKSVVEGATWVDAALNGSKEALDEVVEHNIQDCCLLEKLACILFPYMRSVKRL